MKTINFTKGILFINGYEIVILNGTLTERFTEVELKELNSTVLLGVATTPHRQKTVITGEFQTPIESLGNVLKGDATLQCDGISSVYHFQLFGPYNEGILASELSD